MKKLFAQAAGLALGLLLTAAMPATAAPIIVNGGFEDGGGSFTGWTVVNQAGGSGNWFIQSGVVSPVSGFAVPAPPDPTHAAMTDQTGPGSHVLYQDFLVPIGVSAATLSFQQFIGDRDGPFATPATLDFTTSPNQQARVDIMDPTAPVFSVAGGDVLFNVYQTMTGDATVSGYNLVSADLTALLQAHEGQTLRLRFAEVDNQLFFQLGIDAVNLDVTQVPEPATLSLLGIGLAAIAYRARRTA